MPPFNNLLNFLRPSVDDLMRGRTAPFTPQTTPPPQNQPLTPRNPVNLPPTLALGPVKPVTPPGQAELPVMKMTPGTRDFAAELPAAQPQLAVPQMSKPEMPVTAPVKAADQFDIPETRSRWVDALKSAGLGALLAAQKSGGNLWSTIGGAATGGAVGLIKPGETYGNLYEEAITRPQQMRDEADAYERAKRANDVALGVERANTEVARQQELGARSEIQRQEATRKAAADKLNEEMQRSKDKREQERLQYDRAKPLAIGPNGIYLPSEGRVVEGTPKPQRQMTPTEQRAQLNDEAEANALRDAEADPEWGLRVLTPEQRKMLSTGRKMVPQRDGSNQVVVDERGQPVLIETPLSPGEQAALQKILQDAKTAEIKQRKQYYQRTGMEKQKTSTRIATDPSISKYKGIIPGF